MRRYHLVEPVGEGRRILRVSGKDHHYLSRVLRLQVGDEFDAADSEGRACRARVIEVRRDELRLELWRSPVDPAAPAPAASIHLFQCLPKGAKMDIIVRQATEAGVSTIVPVMSARTILEPSEARVERWRRVALEALQQCGRRAPPEIRECIGLGELVSQRAASVNRASARDLFCHEDPAGAEPLHRILDGEAAEVGILVGPEGGLAPEELGLLRSAGFRQAYLGPNVLRVETAATVSIGAVAILLLERETWKAEPTGESGSSTYRSTP